MQFWDAKPILMAKFTIFKRMAYKPALYLRYPCVQLNFEKSWYDYFSISLFFPYFEADKHHMDSGDSIESTVYSVNAPSTLSVIKSSIHCGVKLQLLGFGVGFLRQNGY